MREIKFRAWDTVRQVMIQEAIVTPFYISDFDRIRLNPSDAVPMQYTGLKDKNGKEIYEGDVLQHKTAAWKGVVMYEEGSFKLETRFSKWSLNSLRVEKVEIIGNIYENPELLQAGLEDGQ